MQQVHRVDDQCDVRGVLAFGVGKLLVGIDGVLLQDIGPRSEVWAGKVAVDAAHAGLAEFRYLLEQTAGNLRRGVVGIDQHGKTRQSLRFSFHRGTLGCGHGDGY